jgi:tetratricopeptide (TPR) repeat protein
LVFYHGVTLARLGRINEAHELLHAAVNSNWALSERKQSLAVFALAKLYQRRGKHAEAVDLFTRSIDTVKEDESDVLSNIVDYENIENSNIQMVVDLLAHSYFRRAWSLKVCL